MGQKNQKIQHDIRAVYNSYEALVNDADVQAVYVANTHNFITSLLSCACKITNTFYVKKPINLKCQPSS